MDISLPLTIEGKVNAGNGIGRTIDVPTANIDVATKVQGIRYGVYYSTTCIDGVSYKSITNVGTKPTVKEDSKVNVETFIFDFSGDLYDRNISVTLLEFRRDEKRFESLDELSKVIQADISAGIEYGKKLKELQSEK